MESNGISNDIGTDGSHSITTPWLSADASKHKIETFSLLPFNRLYLWTLDVCVRNLVCGTDGEAVYVMENLDLGWLVTQAFGLLILVK